MLILYADLDNMKYINDTFSHREGDTALIETGNILKEVFRQSDIIARIGGDEFVVFPFKLLKPAPRHVVHAFMNMLITIMSTEKEPTGYP